MKICRAPAKVRVSRPRPEPISLMENPHSTERGSKFYSWMGLLLSLAPESFLEYIIPEEKI